MSVCVNEIEREKKERQYVAAAAGGGSHCRCSNNLFSPPNYIDQYRVRSSSSLYLYRNKDLSLFLVFFSSQSSSIISRWGRAAADMSGNFLAKRDALIYFSDVITIIELNMLATLFEHHLLYIFMSGEHAAGQERVPLSCRWISWKMVSRHWRFVG